MEDLRYNVVLTADTSQFIQSVDNAKKDVDAKLGNVDIKALSDNNNASELFLSDTENILNMLDRSRIESNYARIDSGMQDLYREFAASMSRAALSFSESASKLSRSMSAGEKIEDKSYNSMISNAATVQAYGKRLEALEALSTSTLGKKAIAQAGGASELAVAIRSIIDTIHKDNNSVYTYTDMARELAHNQSFRTITGMTDERQAMTVAKNALALAGPQYYIKDEPVTKAITGKMFKVADRRYYATDDVNPDFKDYFLSRGVNANTPSNQGNNINSLFYTGLHKLISGGNYSALKFAQEAKLINMQHGDVGNADLATMKQLDDFAGILYREMHDVKLGNPMYPRKLMDSTRINREMKDLYEIQDLITQYNQANSSNQVVPKILSQAERDLFTTTYTPTDTRMSTVGRMEGFVIPRLQYEKQGSFTSVKQDEFKMPDGKYRPAWEVRPEDKSMMYMYSQLAAAAGISPTGIQDTYGVIGANGTYRDDEGNPYFGPSDIIAVNTSNLFTDSTGKIPQNKTREEIISGSEAAKIRAYNIENGMMDENGRRYVIAAAGKETDYYIEESKANAINAGRRKLGLMPVVGPEAKEYLVDEDSLKRTNKAISNTKRNNSEVISRAAWGYDPVMKLGTLSTTSGYLVRKMIERDKNPDINISPDDLDGYIIDGAGIVDPSASPESFQMRAGFDEIKGVLEHLDLAKTMIMAYGEKGNAEHLLKTGYKKIMDLANGEKDANDKYIRNPNQLFTTSTYTDQNGSSLPYLEGIWMPSISFEGLLDALGKEEGLKEQRRIYEGLANGTFGEKKASELRNRYFTNILKTRGRHREDIPVEPIYDSQTYAPNDPMYGFEPWVVNGSGYEGFLTTKMYKGNSDPRKMKMSDFSTMMREITGTVPTVDKTDKTRYNPNTDEVFLTAEEIEHRNEAVQRSSGGTWIMRTTPQFEAEKFRLPKSVQSSLILDQSVFDESEAMYAERLAQLRDPLYIMEHGLGNAQFDRALAEDPGFIWSDKAQSIVQSEINGLLADKADQVLLTKRKSYTGLTGPNALEWIKDQLAISNTTISKDNPLSALLGDGFYAPNFEDQKAIVGRNPAVRGTFMPLLNLMYDENGNANKDLQDAMRSAGFDKNLVGLPVASLFAMNTGDFDGDTVTMYGQLGAQFEDVFANTEKANKDIAAAREKFLKAGQTLVDKYEKSQPKVKAKKMSMGEYYNENTFNQQNSLSAMGTGYGIITKALEYFGDTPEAYAYVAAASDYYDLATSQMMNEGLQTPLPSFLQSVALDKRLYTRFLGDVATNITGKESEGTSIFKHGFRSVNSAQSLMDMISRGKARKKGVDSGEITRLIKNYTNTEYIGDIAPLQEAAAYVAEIQAGQYTGEKLFNSRDVVKRLQQYAVDIAAAAPSNDPTAMNRTMDEVANINSLIDDINRNGSRYAFKDVIFSDLMTGLDNQKNVKIGNKKLFTKKGYEALTQYRDTGIRTAAADEALQRVVDFGENVDDKTRELAEILLNENVEKQNNTRLILDDSYRESVERQKSARLIQQKILENANAGKLRDALNWNRRSYSFTNIESYMGDEKNGYAMPSFDTLEKKSLTTGNIEQKNNVHADFWSEENQVKREAEELLGASTILTDAPLGTLMHMGFGETAKQVVGGTSYTNGMYLKTISAFMDTLKKEYDKDVTGATAQDNDVKRLLQDFNTAYENQEKIQQGTGITFGDIYDYFKTGTNVNGKFDLSMVTKMNNLFGKNPNGISFGDMLLQELGLPTGSRVIMSETNLLKEENGKSEFVDIANKAFDAYVKLPDGKKTRARPDMIIGRTDAQTGEEVFDIVDFKSGAKGSIQSLYQSYAYIKELEDLSKAAWNNEEGADPIFKIFGRLDKSGNFISKFTNGRVIGADELNQDIYSHINTGLAGSMKDEVWQRVEEAVTRKVNADLTNERGLNELFGDNPIFKGIMDKLAIDNKIDLSAARAMTEKTKAEQAKQEAEANGLTSEEYIEWQKKHDYLLGKFEEDRSRIGDVSKEIGGDMRKYRSTGRQIYNKFSQYQDDINSFMQSDALAEFQLEYAGKDFAKKDIADYKTNVTRAYDLLNELIETAAVEDPKKAANKLDLMRSGGKESTLYSTLASINGTVNNAVAAREALTRDAALGELARRDKDGKVEWLTDEHITDGMTPEERRNETLRASKAKTNKQKYEALNDTIDNLEARREEMISWAYEQDSKDFTDSVDTLIAAPKTIDQKINDYYTQQVNAIETRIKEATVRIEDIADKLHIKRDVNGDLARSSNGDFIYETDRLGNLLAETGSEEERLAAEKNLKETISNRDRLKDFKKLNIKSEKLKDEELRLRMRTKTPEETVNEWRNERLKLRDVKDAHAQELLNAGMYDEYFDFIKEHPARERDDINRTANAMLSRAVRARENEITDYLNELSGDRLGIADRINRRYSKKRDEVQQVFDSLGSNDPMKRRYQDVLDNRNLWNDYKARIAEEERTKTSLDRLEFAKRGISATADLEGRDLTRDESFDSIYAKLRQERLTRQQEIRDHIGGQAGEEAAREYGRQHNNQSLRDIATRRVEQLRLQREEQAINTQSSAANLLADTTESEISPERIAILKTAKVRNQISKLTSQITEQLQTAEGDEADSLHDALRYLRGIDENSIHGTFLRNAREDRQKEIATRTLESQRNQANLRRDQGEILNADEEADLAVAEKRTQNNNRLININRQLRNANINPTERAELEQERDMLQTFDYAGYRNRSYVTADYSRQMQELQLQTGATQFDASVYNRDLTRDELIAQRQAQLQMQALRQAEDIRKTGGDVNAFWARYSPTAFQDAAIRDTDYILNQRSIANEINSTQLSALLEGRSLTRQENVDQRYRALIEKRNQEIERIRKENGWTQAQADAYLAFARPEWADDRLRDVAQTQSDNDANALALQLRHREEDNRMQNENILHQQELSREQWRRNRRRQYSHSRVLQSIYGLEDRRVSLREQVRGYNQQNIRLQNRQDELSQLLARRDISEEKRAEYTSEQRKNSDTINANTEAIHNANEEINELGSSGARISAIFQGVSQSISLVATRLGRQVFQKALAETKKFVQEFDSTMTTIQMITLKSNDEIDTLGSSLIDKAKELKISVSEISQSAATLYRQGLSDQEVNDRLEVISKFSKVSGTKVDAATKLVTVAMNTGLVENAQAAADIVTALGDNAATNAAEIEKGIEKAGAAAAADGTSFAQLASMLTAITSTTQIGGNVAGRTLNTIFGRMNKIGTNELIYDENGNAISGSAVAKLLEGEGIRMYDENGNKRSTYDTLYALSQKWEGMSDAKQQQIASAIAGTRQYSNFAAIMQGMSEGKVDEYLALAGESSGITDKKFKIYEKSLEASITDLKNTWDGLVNDMTDTGTIGSTLSFFTNFINGIDKANESLGGLGVTLAGVLPSLMMVLGLKSATPVGFAVAAGGFAISEIVKAIGSQKSTEELYSEALESINDRYSSNNSDIDRAKQLKEKGDNRTEQENAEYDNLLRSLNVSVSLEDIEKTEEERKAENRANEERIISNAEKQNTMSRMNRLYMQRKNVSKAALEEVNKAVQDSNNDIYNLDSDEMKRIFGAEDIEQTVAAAGDVLNNSPTRDYSEKQLRNAYDLVASRGIFAETLKEYGLNENQGYDLLSELLQQNLWTAGGKRKDQAVKLLKLLKDNIQTKLTDENVEEKTLSSEYAKYLSDFTQDFDLQDYEVSALADDAARKYLESVAEAESKGVTLSKEEKESLFFDQLNRITGGDNPDQSYESTKEALQQAIKDAGVKDEKEERFKSLDIDYVRNGYYYDNDKKQYLTIDQASDKVDKYNKVGKYAPRSYYQYNLGGNERLFEYVTSDKKAAEAQESAYEELAQKYDTIVEEWTNRYNELGYTSLSKDEQAKYDDSLRGQLAELGLNFTGTVADFIGKTAEEAFTSAEEEFDDHADVAMPDLKAITNHFQMQSETTYSEWLKKNQAAVNATEAIQLINDNNLNTVQKLHDYVNEQGVGLWDVLSADEELAPLLLGIQRDETTGKINAPDTLLSDILSRLYSLSSERGERTLTNPEKVKRVQNAIRNVTDNEYFSSYSSMRNATDVAYKEYQKQYQEDRDKYIKDNYGVFDEQDLRLSTKRQEEYRKAQQEYTQKYGQLMTQSEWLNSDAGAQWREKQTQYLSGQDISLLRNYVGNTLGNKILDKEALTQYESEYIDKILTNAAYGISGLTMSDRLSMLKELDEGTFADRFRTARNTPEIYNALLEGFDQKELYLSAIQKSASARSDKEREAVEAYDKWYQQQQEKYDFKYANDKEGSKLFSNYQTLIEGNKFDRRSIVSGYQKQINDIREAKETINTTSANAEAIAELIGMKDDKVKGLIDSEAGKSELKKELDEKASTILAEFVKSFNVSLEGNIKANVLASEGAKGIEDELEAFFDLFGDSIQGLGDKIRAEVQDLTEKDILSGYEDAVRGLSKAGNNQALALWFKSNLADIKNESGLRLMTDAEMQSAGYSDRTIEEMKRSGAVPTMDFANIMAKRLATAGFDTTELFNDQQFVSLLEGYNAAEQVVGSDVVDAFLNQKITGQKADQKFYDKVKQIFYGDFIDEKGLIREGTTPEQLKNIFEKAFTEEALKENPWMGVLQNMLMAGDSALLEYMTAAYEDLSADEEEDRRKSANKKKLEEWVKEKYKYELNKTDNFDEMIALAMSEDAGDRAVANALFKTGLENALNEAAYANQAKDKNGKYKAGKNLSYASKKYLKSKYKLDYNEIKNLDSDAVAALFEDVSSDAAEAFNNSLQAKFDAINAANGVNVNFDDITVNADGHLDIDQALTNAGIDLDSEVAKAFKEWQAIIDKLVDDKDISLEVKPKITNGLFTNLKDNKFTPAGAFSRSTKRTRITKEQALSGQIPTTGGWYYQDANGYYVSGGSKISSDAKMYSPTQSRNTVTTPFIGGITNTLRDQGYNVKAVTSGYYIDRNGYYTSISRDKPSASANLTNRSSGGAWANLLRNSAKGRGGGGGGKSGAQTALEAAERATIEAEHKLKLLEVRESFASSRNDVSKFNQALQEQADTYKELEGIYKTNIDNLKAERDKVQQDSDEWLKLTKAINQYEEQLESLSTKIDEINKKRIDFTIKQQENADSVQNRVITRAEAESEYYRTVENVNEYKRNTKRIIEQKQASRTQNAAQINELWDRYREVVSTEGSGSQNAIDLLNKINEINSEQYSLDTEIVNLMREMHSVELDILQATIERNLAVPNANVSMYSALGEIAANYGDYAMQRAMTAWTKNETQNIVNERESKRAEYLAQLATMSPGTDEWNAAYQAWADNETQIAQKKYELYQADVDIGKSYISEFDKEYEDATRLANQFAALAEASSQIFLNGEDFSSYRSALEDIITSSKLDIETNKKRIDQLKELAKEYKDNPDMLKQINEEINQHSLEIAEDTKKIQENTKAIEENRIAEINLASTRASLEAKTKSQLANIYGSQAQSEWDYGTYRENLQTEMENESALQRQRELDKKTFELGLASGLYTDPAVVQAVKEKIAGLSVDIANGETKQKSLTNSYGKSFIDEANNKANLSLLYKNYSYDALGRNASYAGSVGSYGTQASLLAAQASMIPGMISAQQQRLSTISNYAAGLKVGTAAWYEANQAIVECQSAIDNLKMSALQLADAMKKALVEGILKDFEYATMSYNNNIERAGIYASMYQNTLNYEKYRDMVKLQMEQREPVREELKNVIDKLESELPGLRGSSAYDTAVKELYAKRTELTKLEAEDIQSLIELAKSAIDEVFKNFQKKSNEYDREIQIASMQASYYAENKNSELYKEAVQRQSNAIKEKQAYQISQIDEWVELAKTIPENTEEFERLEEQIYSAAMGVAEMDLQILQLNKDIKNMELDELFERFSRIDEIFKHQSNIYSTITSRYQNNGELTNVNYMLRQDNERMNERAKVISSPEDGTGYLELLKAELETVEEGSDEYWRIASAIMSYEEELESLTNTLASNDKAIAENTKLIKENRKNVEDAIREEIKNRIKEQREMLAGTTSLQDKILSIIRKNYTDRFELYEKDAQKQKEALEKEKELINERLQMRKKAMQDEREEEELVELQRQLALISADSSRTKEAKELRAKIRDLEQSKALRVAEDEANAHMEQLDDTIKAIDDDVEYRREKLDDYLEDANNFKEEINMLISSSFEELQAWVAENDETYKNSLAETRQEITNSWEDTWKQMKGIVDMYLEQIQEIIVSSESFLAWMQESSEYGRATESGQAVMNYNWKDIYKAMVNGELDTAGGIHLDDYAYRRTPKELSEWIVNTLGKVQGGKKIDVSNMELSPNYGKNTEAAIATDDLAIYRERLKAALDTLQKANAEAVSEFSEKARNYKSSSEYQNLLSAEEKFATKTARRDEIVNTLDAYRKGETQLSNEDYVALTNELSRLIEEVPSAYAEVVEAQKQFEQYVTEGLNSAFEKAENATGNIQNIFAEVGDRFDELMTNDLIERYNLVMNETETNKATLLEFANQIKSDQDGSINRLWQDAVDGYDRMNKITDGLAGDLRATNTETSNKIATSTSTAASNFSTSSNGLQTGITNIERDATKAEGDMIEKNLKAKDALDATNRKADQDLSTSFSNWAKEVQGYTKTINEWLGNQKTVVENLGIQVANFGKQLEGAKAQAQAAVDEAEKRVNAIYQKYLARDATPEELADKVNKLENGLGESGVSNEISSSTEALIKQLYVGLRGIGYFATNSDVNAWKNYSQDEIIRGFVNSPELAGKNNSEIVNALYLMLLKREAKDAGAQGWINMLNSGTSIIDVARKIAESPEYKGPKFASGGLVDFTGPAWVDGTKLHPESFLDAYDTESLRMMMDSFNYIRKMPYMTNVDTSSYGDTYNVGDINVTINQAEFKDDADYEKVAQRVGQVFTKELQKGGFNVARYAM